MKVLIVGAGFVGTPLAALLASGRMGSQNIAERVTLADRDAARVVAIREVQQDRSKIDPLGERDLARTISKAGNGLLVVHTSTSDMLSDLMFGHDTIVVCVGTPATTEHRIPILDMSAVIEVCDLCAFVAQRSAQRKTVIIRSTTMPGAVQELAERLHAHVDVLVCPEFLREGYAVSDTALASRAVIGALDPEAALRALWLFPALGRVFPGNRQAMPMRTEPRVMLPAEAAWVKLGGNTMLAMRIAFGTLLAAQIADLPEGNYERVQEAIGADIRIGPRYMDPGLGIGGPCLGKDSAAAAFLLEGTGKIEGLCSAATGRAVVGVAHDLLDRKKVLVYGVGFKPESSDWRDSMVIEFVRQIRSEHGPPEIILWDPRLSREEMTELTDHIGDPGVVGSSDGLPTHAFACDAVLLCQRPVMTFFLSPAIGPNCHIVDPYRFLDASLVRVLTNDRKTYTGSGRGAQFLASPIGDSDV